MQARNNSNTITSVSQIPLFYMQVSTQDICTLTTEEAHSNRVKTPQLDQQEQVLERATIYVYVEMLEPGQGKRAIKKMVKVKTFSRKFTVDGKSVQAVKDKVLKGAIDFACEYLYELRDKRTAYSRVIVSKLGDAEKAQKDKEALNYSLLKLDPTANQKLSVSLFQYAANYGVC